MKKAFSETDFYGCCLFFVFIFVGTASGQTAAQLTKIPANVRKTMQRPDAAQSEVLKVANAAFELFAQGVENGDFEPFLKVVSEDVAARLPVEKFRKVKTGKREIAEYLRFVGQELKVRAKVTVTNVAVIKNIVAFEFEVRGVAAGKPTDTQNVVFLEVQNNRVNAFREYFGN